jgi:transcriptional regulator with XRE-family HTH domain
MLGPARRTATMPSDSERDVVAASLRELRDRTRLSTYQLARLLGWSQSKVSKMERGQTLAEPEDVQAWAQATGADPSTASNLVARAEAAASQMRTWQNVHGQGLPGRQREVAQINASAARHREFAPDVIPGLLQTPLYALRVLDLADVSGRGKVEEAAAERMNRQAILYNAAHSFEFVLTEGALRFRAGTPEVMHGQAEKIVSVMSLPNVTVSVIPFSATPAALFVSGFVIYDIPESPMVLVEILSREIQLRSEWDLRLYEDAFGKLRESALTDIAAADLIREAMIT